MQEFASPFFISNVKVLSLYAHNISFRNTYRYEYRKQNSRFGH